MCTWETELLPESLNMGQQLCWTRHGDMEMFLTDFFLSFLFHFLILFLIPYIIQMYEYIVTGKSATSNISYMMSYRIERRRNLLAWKWFWGSPLPQLLLRFGTEDQKMLIQPRVDGLTSKHKINRPSWWVLVWKLWSCFFLERERAITFGGSEIASVKRHTQGP